MRLSSWIWFLELLLHTGIRWQYAYSGAHIIWARQHRETTSRNGVSRSVRWNQHVSRSSARMRSRLRRLPTIAETGPAAIHRWYAQTVWALKFEAGTYPDGENLLLKRCCGNEQDQSWRSTLRTNKRLTIISLAAHTLEHFCTITDSSFSSECANSVLSESYETNTALFQSHSWSQY